MAKYEEIRVRRDSTLNWYASNPRLGLGELGVDMDLQRMKVGNGIDRWNQLPYLNGDAYTLLSKLKTELEETAQSIEHEIADNKLKAEQQIADVRRESLQEISEVRQESRSADKELTARMKATEEKEEAHEQEVSSVLGGMRTELTSGLADFSETKEKLTVRLDEIAGSATEDTEILDARVDAEYVTHPNLGHNIRSVHSEVIALGEAQAKDAKKLEQKTQELDEELSEIRDAAQKSSDKISDLQERTDDNATGILSTVLYLHDETKKRRELSSKADLQNAETLQRDATEFLKDEINTLASAVLAGQITFSQLADKIKEQVRNLTGDIETLRSDLTDGIAKDDELTRKTERLSEVDEALQYFIKAVHEYAIARGDYQQEQINDSAGVSLGNTLKIYELQKAQNSENQTREKETSELREKLQTLTDDTSHTLDRHDAEISRLQEDATDIAAATLANTVTLSEEITRRRTLEEAVSKIKSPVDWSDAESLQIPEPRCAIVNFTGLNSMPTSKTVEIPAYMEFWDRQGNYFKKPIVCSAQGSSSLGYVKKNVKFDLLNDDGSEFDLKIGNWVVQDGFHLKAYYTDFFRGVGVTSYKLWDEIMETKPFKKALVDIDGMNTIATGTGNISDLTLQIDTGALCHPDGFPCIVYLNGEFYGVYSWQIKKQRKNYHMDKSTVEHIHLDGTLGIGEFWNGTINWSAFEIRNPNKLYCMDGNAYDGDKPKELIDETSPNYKASNKNHVRSATVKKYIQGLVQRFNALKQTYSTYKTSDPDRVKVAYEELFDWENMRDYLIFSDVVKNSDGFAKNWQWTSYDGVKWFVNAYDLDMSFGGHWQGIQITAPLTNHITTSTALPVGYVALLYKSELEARYRALRDSGVIDVEHIVSKLADWIARIGEKNYELEFERWPNSPCIKNYNDSVDRVRKWLTVEIANMDKLYNYVPLQTRQRAEITSEIKS